MTEDQQVLEHLRAAYVVHGTPVAAWHVCESLNRSLLTTEPWTGRTVGHALRRLAADGLVERIVVKTRKLGNNSYVYLPVRRGDQ